MCSLLVSIYNPCLLSGQSSGIHKCTHADTFRTISIPVCVYKNEFVLTFPIRPQHFTGFSALGVSVFVNSLLTLSSLVPLNLNMFTYLLR